MLFGKITRIASQIERLLQRIQICQISIEPAQEAIRFAQGLIERQQRPILVGLALQILVPTSTLITLA